MSTLSRKLVAPVLLGGLTVLAWQFWPHQAAPLAPSAVAPAAHSPLREPVTPVALKAVAGPTTQAVAVNSVVESDDVVILRQLDQLAASDKPRALEFALAADELLPDTGVFAEARRALIVTLSVDVQHMSEARERAKQFIAAYPTSPYLTLVQGVTGLHSRPSPSQMRDARDPTR